MRAPEVILEELLQEVSDNYDIKQLVRELSNAYGSRFSKVKSKLFEYMQDKETISKKELFDFFLDVESELDDTEE